VYALCLQDRALAFAADLRGINQAVAMLAGERSVAEEKPPGTIAALAYEYRTRLAETCSDPMNCDVLIIS